MESIPQEIWTKIFNYITLYRDLIQCQQVCKRWRHPAETAMFSIKDLIEIRSEKQLIALCNHLEKDPSRGKLISSLHVMFRNDRSSIHVEGLVRLAFTPNIRSLFGTAFDTDKTYQLMDAIVKDSKVKFTRMQVIARYRPSQWYDRFLLNFTESMITLDLRNIDLSLSTNIFINQHLEKFVNVKALLFDVAPNLTIQKLESVLNKCPNVNNLEVDIAYGSVSLPAFHQVTAWTDANIKTSRMDLLCMNGWVLYRPDMVEYFVRKYPNTREFVFGSCVVEFQNGEDNEEEEEDEEEIRRITSNLYRSLAILKELKDYEIQIKLPPGVYLDDVVSRMQTEDNFIVIDHYYRTEQLLQARSKPRHLIKLNL